MKPKKQKHDETGVHDRGRHTFYPSHAEAIRAFLRCHIASVTRTIEKLRASATKLGTDRIDGQIEYFANALSWLTGLYRSGPGSVDLTDWLVEYDYVTTSERHTRSTPTPESRTLPGME